MKRMEEIEGEIFAGVAKTANAGNESNFSTVEILCCDCAKERLDDDAIAAAGTPGRRCVFQFDGFLAQPRNRPIAELCYIAEHDILLPIHSVQFEAAAIASSIARGEID